MIKKFLLFMLFFICSVTLFSLSLADLVKITLEYNSEIQNSLTAYETSRLSSKNTNGSYSPNITTFLSSRISEEYEWDEIPDSLSYNIIYTQPLPGGMSISLGTNYALSSTPSLEERFISQSPNFSLSITQSLLPFWAQGKINDPIRISLKQQEEYHYYQFLYSKKNILMNLFQNYMYVLIYQNEIAVYQNTINLYNEQATALKKFKDIGNISASKILEIENSKWDAQQNLISAQSNYITCIQNLKSICGQNFDENSIESNIAEDFENILFDSLDGILDPLEFSYKLKLEILKSERLLEKQSYAPMLSFSIQPCWVFNPTKPEEWKTAWDSFDTPSFWNASIGLDLSPMFSGIIKENKKKYQLNYNVAEKTISSYLQQKDFIKQQNKTLLIYYMRQEEILSELYNSSLEELKDLKEQYDTNVLSKFEFDSVQIRVENYRLSKENIKLYIYLYSMLLKLY